MKKFLFLTTLSLAITSKGQSELTYDSLDTMIGQMIMIGIGDFSEPNSNESIFREIKEGKVGGVVLYEKNLSKENTKATLAQLTGKLQKNAEIPLFIGIDEEGGRVTRLKEKYGFPKNVSAQELGEMDNLDTTRFYANQITTLLDSFGINMNYAPVVDVNTNPENPVIGKLKRSYSSDYVEVIKQAKDVIGAHNNNNVIPVLKHFPGHGSSKNDTHLGLADVTETWQFEELYPYKALIDSGGVTAIMTAHIVNKSLDQTKIPATLSKRVVTGMLREFLGFQGVVVSDDMQMGAIKNEYGIKEAVRMSIDAGVDILMFANNVKDYDMVTSSDVHSLIKEMVEEGVISRERVFESYSRIMNLKKEFRLLDEGYYKALKNKLKGHH
ncbi:MAG: glycoside hydrolase family 3 N-terminal domain-containing protein [Cyclobacteriaceae bacterium]